MIKKYGDIISGTAFLIFSLVLFVLSLSIEVSTISKYGGAVVPQGIALIMTGLSSIVIIGGIMNLKRFEKSPPVKKVDGSLASRSGVVPVVSALVVSIIYVLLLNSVGFIIMTIACLSTLMFILSGFTKKKIVIFTLISAIFSVGINYIFSSVFYLMLPSGILS